MNKFFFTTLLLIILSTTSNYANADDYNTCATNADGAILVDERDVDNTSFALASSPTSFTHTAFGDTTRGGYCDVTPDFYKVKMYQFGLCKEMPYQEPDDTARNTIGADLSSCVFLFDNAAGKELIIEPDKEVKLLDGGELLLPTGTYPFIYILLDNVIQIKHIQEYVDAGVGGADFEIKGYDPDDDDPADGSKGKWCYTGLDENDKRLVFTSQQERQFGSFTTLRGFTLPTNFTGKQSTAGFFCSNEATAKANNDWAVSIIENFGDKMAASQKADGTPVDRIASNFRNAMRRDRGFHDDFPTIIQAYYLYNSNDTPATSATSAEKILFLQHDSASNVVIAEDTVGFKINFKTNNAVEMSVYEEAGGNDQILMATAVNANSIFVKIETKTKRSRGAWR
jgi:hypothetical protein